MVQVPAPALRTVKTKARAASGAGAERRNECGPGRGRPHLQTAGYMRSTSPSACHPPFAGYCAACSCIYSKRTCSSSLHTPRTSPVDEWACPPCSLAYGGSHASAPSSHVGLRPQRGALVVSGRHPALGHKMRQDSLGDEMGSPPKSQEDRGPFPDGGQEPKEAGAQCRCAQSAGGGGESPGIAPSAVGPELSVLLLPIQQIRVFSLTASRHIYTLPGPCAVLAEAGAELR